MFSRNADACRKETGPSGLLGSWPIAARLSVFYAVASFSTLLVASGFLYWALQNNLEREDNRFLAEKIRVLQTILHERDKEDLQEELETKTTEPQSVRYYGRITDNGGRVLVQTPGMGKILPLSMTFPVPLGSDEEPGRGTKLKSRDGKSYLFMAAWKDIAGQAGKTMLIQAGLDVSDDEALLAEYRARLGAVLFLGALFSTGAGIGIARRGMRPVEEITKAMQKITAAQLHERIAPEEWPRELTSLAAAFNSMLDRLEDSFGRLSRFSADLAHELRTPINNLRGESEVALARTRTAGEYREVLESSLEECGRLSRMIDSLLFLAREDDKNEIKLTPFDAGAEIKAVLEFYEALADEQGIETADYGTARLIGDPGLFRRALSNLLDNAFQYTLRGGTITVHAEEREDGFAEIRVTDTGAGIEPEHLPKIFDRFYRTDWARSAYPQGTGLGLSIVKSIMRLHGGEITVCSEPSRGTTATLIFPLRQ